ncbi:MAG: ABC transporter ATP-binding protein/permease [Marinifilaceae bacterium]|jgi:ATP-binding cassette subfamily B protein|nr:ABC transporter ATP-binding protein/permease [Marinifilaceae bacterium]
MDTLKYLQKRFALSKAGAKSFIIGVVACSLLNLCLMLPAIYIFLFLKDNNYSLVYYILIGLVFMVIMYFASVFQYRSVYTSVYHESAIRRIKLAETLRKLPLSFFGKKDLSDLTSTIMEDCTQLEHTFSHAVPQLFASAFTICLMAVGLFIFNWQLSLALFWVIPCAVLILVLSKKYLNKENSKEYIAKRSVSNNIQEGLETIQDIKAYNLDEQYLSTLNSSLDNYLKHLTKTELVAGTFVNSSVSFLKLGLASVILVGLHLVIQSEISLFTYIIFLVLGTRIYEPVIEVFNNLAALYYLDVRIKRITDMESMKIQTGKKEFNPKNYDIEFKDVAFSYEKNQQVIKNLSFIAKQGEITALVGPSGGGKSTVAKLAARFWDIDSGKILLGGVDISTIDPEAILKYFSMVFQDVVLFNTSVRDNIKMGNKNASDEDVEKVCKLSRCHEFIMKLPNGYDTVISENGDSLSGGERQRISIARALLKDAPIILLDEATASIDVDNETKIQEGLSRLIKNKTVLVIAHRTRTIENANKIIKIGAIN